MGRRLGRGDDAHARPTCACGRASRQGRCIRRKGARRLPQARRSLRDHPGPGPAQPGAGRVRSHSAMPNAAPRRSWRCPTRSARWPIPRSPRRAWRCTAARASGRSSSPASGRRIASTGANVDEGLVLLSMGLSLSGKPRMPRHAARRRRRVSPFALAARALAYAMVGDNKAAIADVHAARRWPRSRLERELLGSLVAAHRRRAACAAGGEAAGARSPRCDRHRDDRRRRGAGLRARRDRPACDGDREAPHAARGWADVGRRDRRRLIVRRPRAQSRRVAAE